MKLYQVALISAGSMTIGAAAWAQAAPVVWKWPASLEAINAAPRNHRVLYEDSHVSLLEVTIQPGEKEKMHGHMYPSVFAYDAEQPAMENTTMEDGKTVKIARSYTSDNQLPACRTMGIQAPHQVKITDNFPQHFYRLQFKRMDKTNTAAMHYSPAS
jgi:hypothetical protein